MWTTFHLGHYVPLSWMTLGFDYAVWGMNPVGYHLTNLLLHAANALLVYFLALRLYALGSSTSAVSSARIFAAAVAALAFSIHPLRVESVAWITERRDVLSALFFLRAFFNTCGPATNRRDVRTSCRSSSSSAPCCPRAPR